jgi:hypothetical protein
MTFGGGPLNGFVLQAMCRMAKRCARTPAGGALTAISGMIASGA